ncbi:hypothetical protein GCM10009069_16880 [Algimonas arctica]|uniref:Uncharacterized protein n=1 Tax=Algimonas arctica TaxID=1479486 RepID=A0A8J3G2D0_9PROT|nr:hypothetical protein [Algimonas arctica]GHA94567.1 hypothetical protein GCM10009069_16880 [Algimonas arctica]
MAVLRQLAVIFLFPGTTVLSSLNIAVDSDGGIFRSMINMIFWGIIAMFCTLPFVIR